MDSNQDFGSILNNHLTLGQADRPPREPAGPAPSVDEFVKSVMPAAQKAAQKLNVPVEAVIGQWGLETGWGKSVIPGTNNLGNIKGRGVAATDNMTGSRDEYRQYGSVDEFADDFTNLVGNGRYKAVPGSRDAQGYFQNLKAAGYAEDPDYVAKGGQAAAMAAEALKRAGVSAPAKADQLPDLTDIPKWGQIAAGKKYNALPDAEKKSLKAKYFDEVIAPHAKADGADVAAERARFLAEKQGMLDQAWDATKGFFNGKESVLEGAPPAPELATTSKVPVRKDVRAAFNAAWDSATPEQRAQMQGQEGWTGMLARERAGVFERQDGVATPTTQKFDPRIEARRNRLVGAGEDPAFAERAAMEGANRGLVPGRELEALGGMVQKSEFDFDTKAMFDTQGDRNGLNNPLGRGVAKAVLGTGKAAAGYMEFLGDLTGLKGGADGMREFGKGIRGQEEAIGESGGMLERNLEGAISSIGQQLPLMIAGVGVGSQVLPLAGMALQSFGQEYSDGKARGQSLEQAAARAGLFAAFEVIGEKFGLGAQMEALKGAAKGMPSDQIIGLLWSALKKEVPGEILTTTGQFSVDKFAPGGIGLNPNATFADYVQQVGDTITQTVMQAGLMGAGTTGVSTAVRYMKDRGPLEGVANADAELARQQALNKWNNNGLAPRVEPTMDGDVASTVTPDGRIEPTGTPEAQSADSIVRELAEQAGIPTETVLPTPPINTLGDQPAPPADDDQTTDQDVIDFAAARFQQLREKQNGSIQTVVGEDGMSDQDVPGVGLSPAERQELTGLERANQDPAALRAMYGMEAEATAQESELDTEARLEREAIQSEQGLVGDQVADDTDIPFDAPAQPVGTTGEGAGASQPTQEQPIAIKPVQEVAPPPVAEQPAAPPPKPRTEKEAKQQKALDRIARGSAYFTKEGKAREWITANGLTDTHTVERDASGANKWNIVAKKEAPSAQAPEAKQAETQREEAPAAGAVSQKPTQAQIDAAIDAGVPFVSQFKTGDALVAATRQALANKPKTEKEAKAKKAAVTSNSGHYAAGIKDRQEGRPRVLPSYFTDKAGKNAKDWYRGWDAANVEAPVVKQDLTADDGQQDDTMADPEMAAYENGLSAGTRAQDVGDLSKKPAETNTSAEPVQKTSESEQFAGNKLFTADAVAKARARMKSKLGTLNSGLDPELMVDGVTIAGAYIESGVRSFSAYSKAMVDDFGDKIRPYLRSFYEGVRHYPGLDTTGMSTPAEIDLMEKQGTAEHTKPAPGTEAAVGETVPAPKRTNERKPADLTLRNDFGVKHIDGYGESSDNTRENALSDVKSAFLNDTRKYLSDVAGRLQAAGFVPHNDRKGKPMKAVSVNEAGAAVSGDVTLTMFHPDMQKGVYITIGGTSLRGNVPTTASGVAVMMRVTKAGDQYGGDQNRWMPVNLSSTELADLAAKEVEKVATRAATSTIAKPETTAQNDAKERTENVTASNDGTTQGSGPAADGVKRTDVDLAGGKPDQVQETGGRGQDAGQDEKPEARAEAGERVPQRPRDDARQPDGKNADGRSANDAVTPQQGATPTNFTITDELNFAGQGAKTKYANNVSAIRLLKRLEAEGRQANADEQKTLAKYIGWGGMPQAFDPKNDKWAKEFAELKELLTADEYATAVSSTRNAHYTAAPVVNAIWAGLARLGFKNGAVLEPSLGSGNFFGLMPVAARAKSRLFGVEFDHITGGIAKHLYPQAKVNAPIGFQDIKLAPESFDVAAGNPPFGDESLYDKANPEISKFKIHGFFFAKSVETLKPGGVLAMVVSKGLMDANDARGKAARAWLAERTRLLGAIRLPNSAFQENANTEVTTDIVFLQKLSDEVKPNASEWNAMGEVKDQATGQPIAINKYFVANPDMMLGEMTLAGSMYRANEPTLSAREGGNLTELLAKAIEKLPQGVFKVGKAAFVDAGAKSMSGTAEVREYGHYIQNGKLYQRQPDYNGERVDSAIQMEGRELERMTGMIGLRDLVRKQLALEKSAASTTEQIEANRADLNKAYDAFVKKNGYLNSPTNKRLFAEDSDAALVQSLEAKYDKGVSEAVAKSTGQKPRQAKASKATIFTKRVQTPVAMVTKASTAKEAMLASLNERGGIDLEFMAGLYGKDADAIVSELGDLVFEDPASGWMPADLYLSGNVKAALAKAKDAAQRDARFQRNVAALMAVQPADINPSDIFVKIGSPWVAVSDYNDFAKATFGGGMTGSFMPATGNWSVDVKRGSGTENDSTFGTTRMGADRIIETLMSNKQVAVYDEYKDADGNTKRILNAEETAAAQGKADALAEAFQEWIWNDNDRRERLSRTYNDTYNTNIKRTYDGSHLTLPGANVAIQLRPHQLNWVYRSLVDGKGLADHVVGAGKTFAIIASMMEMRRLGMANKPMIVVPNHLVGQWAKDIMTLYPGANVLAASRKDFQKDRRKLLFSRIATGDWDMVVVAHSSFGRIPVPPETEKKILDDQLSELTLAITEAKREKGARFTVKDLERAKTKIEEKLKKLADRKQDDALDFADLGVDAMAVDEAHEFKNLFYTTTMQGVAGLGSPTGSTRAFDMFVKTRYITERAGGKNVFFATGTPVANSLAEVFHMQRFLQYDTLKARGIHNFDAWANTFAMSTADWEQNAAGKYVQKTRFRKFANLPELKGIWGEVADTVTRADLMSDAEKQGKRFPLPKVKGGKPENVVTERSPLQAEFIGIPKQEMDKDGKPVIDDNGQPVMTFKSNTVVYRLENWKELSKENPKEIPLAITGQARKAGLDYRLIDENAPDFEGSKVNAAVSRIFDTWKANDQRKGTQLVFCDLSVPASAKGQATAEAAEKVPTFFVRMEPSGRPRHVPGKPLALTGLPDFEFFTYKEGKEWLVHERATGGLFARGKTKQEALDAANTRAARVDPQYMRNQVADKAFTQEQLDDYIARWEEQQAQAEDNGSDDDTAEPAKEISMDEMLADGGGSFSVYDDIKAKLVAKGMPADQIAFIHDYNTDDKKSALFAAVNGGEVRVLLGSTQKMGAGTNVQAKLVALHHMDAPWRPADLEQREGRIIRQGNEFYEADPDGFEVGIYRYATKQTYDSRMWEIIETKARGIELFKSDGSLREIEDVGSESANAAEMKAGASGNPLILESIGLGAELRKLQAMKKSWERSRFDLEKKIKSATDKTGWVYNNADIAVEFAATVTPKSKDALGLKVFGTTINTEKDVTAEALASKMMEAADSAADGKLAGTYRGVNIYVRRGQAGVTLFTSRRDYLVTSTTYGPQDKFSVSGFITRMDNLVDGVTKWKDSTAQAVVQFEKDAESAKKELARGFPKDAELKSVNEKHKAVVAALRAGKTSLDDSLNTSTGDALPRFVEKFGGQSFNLTDALYAAEQITGLGFDTEIAYVDGINDGTPMRVNLKTRVIEVNPNAKMTQAEAVQYLIEELLHRVDVLSGGKRSITAGSKRFHPLTGDIGQEAQAAFENNTAGLSSFFYYPLNPMLGYDYQRIRAELFARMGVLYFADPTTFKRVFPNAHDFYSSIFPIVVSGDNRVLQQVWGTPTRSAGQVRGKPGAGGQAGRGLGQSSESRNAIGLERLRAKIGRESQSAQSGTALQGVSLDTRRVDTGDDATPSSITRRIQNNAIQFFGNRDKTPGLKTFGAYDKTLATQFHKALKDKHYGKVFAYVNAMQNEVSLTSIRPAELAPGVLPRVDDVKSAAKQLFKGKKADKNLEVAATAIFAGTLYGDNVLGGKVFTEAEFMAMPGATPTGYALYRQARDAIDASLDEVAAAEAYAMAQGFVPKGMRRSIIDNPMQAENLVMGEIDRQIKTLAKAIKAAKRMEADQQAAELEAARNGYLTTRRSVEKIFITAKNLKAAGYAPLMRFGKFTVTVQAIDPETGNIARNEDGESITEFYGQYETEGEAKSVRAMMEQRYGNDPGYRVTAGTKSQTSHELYAGISPETLALFAEAIGADQTMRKHIELAMSERSALKRRLERKGTAGYSSDMPRVLSNFITSNGRHAAQRYYLRDLNNAIKYIPKEKGDVLDEAMRLKKFVMNPSDPAAPVSSIMFAWFLGGSVASAMVNLSQPVMMTGPYLSQFGIKTATKAMAESLPYALGKKEITDAGMRDALKRASQEGIVDAQEIFHLYSVGAQGVASGLVNTLSRLPGVGGKIKAGSEDARARINAFLTLWGSMFSLAESFNRKLTFIAAYKVAQANGEKNAYQFAVRAVNETQGIYNKVNRPNWAQGPVGRTVLTFKQFSIMYVELLSRMVKKGGPEGKRAALIMLATLMLAAGEEGLPFAQDLDDLIDTLGQLLGYDTNMKRWKRRHAHEIMGKELGDLFLYGISSQLPLDFAGRLGMGNLIPGTGLLKPSTDQGQVREVTEVFGPAAGLIGQIADAYDAAVEGNTGKALQNLAPTAVKNTLAGAEMAAKGYATDTKGRKVIEVDGVDAAFKSIGFQPTQVARETRKTTPVYQDLALQKRVETSIVAQWAQAVAEGDNKAAQKQQQRLTDWNRDNPDTPIRITPDQIRSKARQMATDKDARLLKLAPREMRGRLGLDLAD